MSGIGVHFALNEEVGSHLRSITEDQERREYLYEVIAESDDVEFSRWVVECDEAWDAMHRVLTNGELSSDSGAYPLDHVVLGGEILCQDPSYLLSLKTSQQVRDIAAALPPITEEEFRRRYFAIDPQDYAGQLSAEYCDWTWNCFQQVVGLYTQAAQEGRYVFFEWEDQTAAEETTKPLSFFRNFGVLPTGAAPSDETVRSFISPGRIVFEYMVTLIFAALGLGLMQFLMLKLPQPLNWLGGAAALIGFATYVYLGTHKVYRWIELEGNILRVKYLFTGRTLERSIDEIKRVDTLIGQMRQMETVVIDGLLGRVRGVSILFRDDYAPLHVVRIMRTDPAMIQAEELIQALYARMSQIREIHTELVNVDGVPLVGYVHWKDDEPGTPTASNVSIVLGCAFIGLALAIGAIMGFQALGELEREAICSVPPQELALAKLIENGPGANRHVTITDFKPGIYIAESKDDSWKEVWVPLFPAGMPAREIKVVLSSRAIRDEVALDPLLQQPRITGICSADQRSNWGSTLGPQLVEANQNLPLTSAWELEDVSKPPNAEGYLIGSAVSFSLVVLIAMFLGWKSGRS